VSAPDEVQPEAIERLRRFTVPGASSRLHELFPDVVEDLEHAIAAFDDAVGEPSAAPSSSELARLNHRIREYTASDADLAKAMDDVNSVAHYAVPRHKVDAIVADLKRETDGRQEAERALSMVRQPAADVWFWEGGGADHPESLSCPVVMSADKLRELLGTERSTRRSILLWLARRAAWIRNERRHGGKALMEDSDALRWCVEQLARRDDANPKREWLYETDADRREAEGLVEGLLITDAELAVAGDAMRGGS
jgi:hypothetical protein